MSPKEPEPRGRLANPSASVVSPGLGAGAGSEPEVSFLRRMPAGLIAELTASSFSSPFPPPDLLKGYEEIKPGFSEHILEAIKAESAHRRKLQEEEAIHRRKLEADLQAATIEDTRASRTAECRGQYLALIVCLFIVGCGAAVALWGNAAAGAVIGSGAPILGVINAFLLRRSVQSPESPKSSTAEPRELSESSPESPEDAPPSTPTPESSKQNAPEKSGKKNKNRGR